MIFLAWEEAVHKQWKGFYFSLITSILYLRFLGRHDLCGCRDLVSRSLDRDNLRLLVDPVLLGVLVLDDLTLAEPKGDLLLGVLDAVGAVADVAADVLFDLCKYG